MGTSEFEYLTTTMAVVPEIVNHPRRFTVLSRAAELARVWDVRAAQAYCHAI
jgi:hypothetical protein